MAEKYHGATCVHKMQKDRLEVRSEKVIHSLSFS